VASLRRMGVLVTTIYASEAFVAYTIPGSGLTTELRAIRVSDRSALWKRGVGRFVKYFSSAVIVRRSASDLDCGALPVPRWQPE
jgi:hypothetical protein